MATRKVVPRADAEGGIGTALLRWASGFFAALSSGALTVTSFVSAGFVKNSAAGVLSGGNSIVAGDLPAGFSAVRHLSCIITDPNALPVLDVCLIPALDAAIHITHIEVTCEADPATQITGDLKYADAFIGLANPVLVNDFDTTAGVRSDGSITTPAIAAGKCLYLSFDVAPIVTVLEVAFDIAYTID